VLSSIAEEDAMHQTAHDSRRRALLGAALCATALAALPRSARAQTAGLKIGIIGTGRIGGALARHWAKAGYQLMISSRHPEQLKPLAEGLGPQVRVGTPEEAAAFGEVLLISVPYGALPQVGRDYAAQMRGKVVLETGNPFPNRDGEMAEAARVMGTGFASAELLPGVRLVRVFTSVPHTAVLAEAHRSGERIGVPLAADDAGALKIAEQLVRDAGFDPVVVGGLARAKDFDVGTPVFGRAMTAAELRQALGLVR
jgi:predicted dinucleotide-binding enzyme